MRKVGLVTTLNNSGLGVIGKSFIEQLPIDSIFVIRHAKKGTHEECVHGLRYMVGGYPPTVEEIHSYLDEYKPEALMFVEYPYNWDFIRIAHSRGIRIIYIPMVDSVSVDWMKKEGVLELISTFLCVTGYSRMVMARDDLPAVYIPWPVDTHKFKPVDKDRSDNIHLLHNAGFLGANLAKPRKGTDIVLEAFQHLKNHGFTLTMHAQLHQKKWNLKGVDYREGDFPDSRRMYDLGQIYVAPSRMEGLGLPIDEAMACGLIVITTDIPPVNERVIWQDFLIDCDKVYYTNRSNAVVAEPSINSLIEKLLALRDMPLKYWGQKCRKHMEENFAWDILRPRYLEVLSGENE